MMTEVNEKFRIYCDNRESLMYFHAPKCASRTILGWLAIINNENVLSANKDWFDEARNDDYGHISSSILKKTLSQSLGKPSFCVIRNPIERFLSAFADRVLKVKLESFWEIKNVSNFIENFDYFCSKYPVLHHHIKPQWTFYGKDRNLISNHFRFSELNSVKEFLQDFFLKKLPHLHLQSSVNIEKPVLKDSEVKFLKEYYKADYEIYGQYM